MNREMIALVHTLSAVKESLTGEFKELPGFKSNELHVLLRNIFIHTSHYKKLIFATKKMELMATDTINEN